MNDVSAKRKKTPISSFENYLSIDKQECTILRSLRACRIIYQTPYIFFSHSTYDGRQRKGFSRLTVLQARVSWAIRLIETRLFFIMKINDCQYNGWLIDGPNSPAHRSCFKSFGNGIAHRSCYCSPRDPAVDNILGIKYFARFTKCHREIYLHIDIYIYICISPLYISPIH